MIFGRRSFIHKSILPKPVTTHNNTDYSADSIASPQAIAVKPIILNATLLTLYLALLDVLAHPLHAVLDALAGLGGAGLDLPRPILDLLKAQAQGDLVGLGGAHQVLLVGEDEEGHAGELLLAQ